MKTDDTAAFAEDRRLKTEQVVINYTSVNNKISSHEDQKRNPGVQYYSHEPVLNSKLNFAEISFNPAALAYQSPGNNLRRDEDKIATQ